MPGPYVVPGVTSNISDDFATHLARGSAGGDDFTDGYGTRMQAIQGGTVIAVDNNPSGSGGRMVTVLGDDGNQFEELHADRITAFRGQRREQRDELGISGASGFGQDWYYGPHIHVHAIDPAGRRFSIVPYLGGGFAGGTTTPFPSQKDHTMLLFNRTESKPYPIDILIGEGFAFASPEAVTTNMLKAAYPAQEGNDTALDLIGRAHGINDGVLRGLKPGQGWRAGVGYFDPDKTSPVPTGSGGAVMSDAKFKELVDSAIDDDIAKLLVAIAGVDEATLTTFGLKRL